MFEFFKKKRGEGATESPSVNAEVIIANLEDGVVVYDNTFKISLFNKAAERILGVSKGDVLGKVIGPESVKEKKLRLLTQTIFPSLAPLVLRQSEPNVYPQVALLSFSEPKLELRVLTDRVTDSSGKPTAFMKVIHDRTREVELSHSKSEFITIAAHQLRTPLTAINWTFENLVKSTTLGEEDRSLIQDGLAASVKVLEIVNDLLDVAKIEEGRFGYNLKEIEIISFLESVLKNAEVVAKQYGTSLYFDKGGLSALSLQIDPERLGLAISNLIDNAIRYNVRGGSVTVSLKKLSDKPFVEISIQDTGIGIPPEEMPKLFTKFFRAGNAVKLETEGSGLGLYITQKIIARHGGTIWAESTLGRGSTFYFTLPTDPKLIPPQEVFYEE